MFTTAQYSAAAAALGCEPEMIEAVCQKEIGKRKSTFSYKGREIPLIVYERHVNWDLLTEQGINPASLIKQDASLADILAQTPYKRYGKYIQQYARRDRAITIHREAAFGSCSYSSFQIMGYHHAACGYETAEAFAEAMADPNNHLPAFVEFIKAEGLATLLAKRDFEGFARRYNGKEYWKKGYHIELARIYQRMLARNLPRHETVLKAALQSGTVKRGAAITATAMAPIVTTSTSSDILTSLLDTAQQLTRSGQNTLDQVQALHDKAEQLAPILAWLPWAVGGWTVLLIAGFALLVRRYLLDRGYL